MQKQIIGMVHFSPLEGDPNFPGKDVVLRRAQEDLVALAHDGIDAVLFENNFDNSKFERLPPQQAAHFSELVRTLSPSLSIPWGISALWNDYELGFRLCKKYGGVMIRVPVFVDSVETVYGTFLANPKRVIQVRSDLEARAVKILADVQVKHARMLHPRPLGDSVKEAVSSGADIIVITGTWTGDPPTVEMVREAQAHAKNTPIYIGSGMTADNIASFLPFIDGCIVGTAFKASDAKQLNGPNVVGPEIRYDTQHIRDFVRTARRFNETMPPLVIFVCRGNIHRSVVAEFATRQLLAKHGYHNIQVESRGVQLYMSEPPIHENLMSYPEAWENSHATLEKYSIDLSRHVAKVLSPQDMKQANIVIVMDQELLQFTRMKFPEYKNKIHLFSELIGKQEDIPDLGEHATSGDYQSAIVNIFTMLQQGIPRLISWLKVTPRE